MEAYGSCRGRQYGGIQPLPKGVAEDEAMRSLAAVEERRRKGLTMCDACEKEQEEACQFCTKKRGVQ